MYESFLKYMGAQYAPEKIKGKSLGSCMTKKPALATLQMEDLEL